ncbi:MAG: hypothetical protein R2726_16475 [Acidimicrobiales bacterium]
MSDTTARREATGSSTGVGGDDALAHRLRRALLWIAVATTAGTTVELASLEHWTEKTQLIAWMAVVVLAVAIAIVWRARTTRAVQLARLLAVGVCGAAAIGVVAHVHGNYEAGPLDAQYGDRWDSMSQAARWWAALVKQVGPSPPLAPGILVIASLAVLFATVGHPALTGDAS